MQLPSELNIVKQYIEKTNVLPDSKIKRAFMLI